MSLSGFVSWFVRTCKCYSNQKFKLSQNADTPNLSRPWLDISERVETLKALNFNGINKNMWAERLLSITFNAVRNQSFDIIIKSRNAPD